MIKLSFCLHRLPHLSREEFQSYWRNTHAPLVRKNREPLRIRRYVQCHAATTELNDAVRAGRNAPEMYDGVAELWWENFDDLRRRWRRRKVRRPDSNCSKTNANSSTLRARRSGSAASSK